MIWSTGALADLQEIADYIALDKPDAAGRWAKVLAAMAEQAAELPFAGRRVPEFARDDVREVIKRGYRVVYQVGDERVVIYAVSEGHRRLPVDILDR
ncbi:type II toxin-antitoxin system RelE/ParE family toxin [Enhygromyxa salina]|uniref:type II toxin-antitoxin system RelE/ParE family toxin n=1 Tax=Enhygromyxa salina TaxID=215803 RepID=UPI0015E663B0|nr:type II toxin-antitoxin system RelE/ParE family toxin [Enhygromyxa salina]